MSISLETVDNTSPNDTSPTTSPQEAIEVIEDQATQNLGTLSESFVEQFSTKPKRGRPRKSAKPKIVEAPVAQAKTCKKGRPIGRVQTKNRYKVTISDDQGEIISSNLYKTLEEIQKDLALTKHVICYIKDQKCKFASYSTKKFKNYKIEQLK